MTRARGLAGFASAISGPVNSIDLNVGVLTATNVNVGGTITYEDVSNVDSVGIITAQAGIRVTGGNVGINEASPQERLQIDGNIKLSSNNQYLKFIAGNSQQSGLLAIDADSNNRAGINFQGVAANQVTAITFSTSDTVNTMAERMRIDDDGNVGIGTNNPATTLHLKNSDPRITITDSDTGGDFVIRNTSGAGYLTVENHPLLFYTDSTERLRIASSGNVGIGTQNPANKLEVGGVISATDLFVTSGGDTTSNNISGKFSHGGINSKSLVIGADPNNVGGNTRLQFDVDGTERLRIVSSGNVGIGTDNPQARLHVYQPLEGAFDNSCILSRGADPRFQFRVTNGANSNSSGQAVTRYGIYYDGTGWDQYFQFDRGNGAQDGSTRFYNSNGTYNTMVLYSTGYIGCPARLTGGSTGGLSANTAGTIIRTSSDGTLKENVTPIGSQYETVKALNPVTYTWIDTDFMGDQTELGFIAQEVQPHIPEVISTNGDGKLSLDYPKLTATLTKALQEAIAKIETLETKVAALEGN